MTELLHLPQRHITFANGPERFPDTRYIEVRLREVPGVEYRLSDRLGRWTGEARRVYDLSGTLTRRCVLPESEHGWFGFTFYGEPDETGWRLGHGLVFLVSDLHPTNS